jgi:hypothetical protein
MEACPWQAVVVSPIFGGGLVVVMKNEAAEDDELKREGKE